MTIHKKTDCRFHKIILLLLFCSLISMIAGGCITSGRQEESSAGQSSNFITKSAFLLNTEVSITIYDKQEEAILQDCMDLISRYEKIFSRTDDTSELYALNHGTAPHDGLTYRVSEELADIINKGISYGKLSGGAFDISIAPVSSLWNFLSSDPVLPDPEALKKALTFVDYRNIKVEGTSVSFAKEGMAIDLGGIAKGYIADRVKELLQTEGVKSAMINLGGNVLCVGKKPDGTPFRVGIQKPFAERNETLAILEIDDLSVVSSGVYERYFKLDDVIYHHILDPKTGYPYQNDLTAVTIVSKKSTDGDGLSTSCFALGLNEGLKLIESIPDTYAAFVTADDQIHYSNGFQTAVTMVK